MKFFYIHLNRFLRKIRLPIALLFMVVSFSAPVFSGHIHGNGGDHVRATFFKIGQSVLSYLRETQGGAALVAKHKLDLAKLERTLSIDVVSVEERPLIDNGSSQVDAIGEKGLIVLSKNTWIDHFEKSRDVYYLVFHEMLRASEIGDDDYIVSGALNPFPQSRRVLTRIETRYPLVGGDNLAKIFEASEIAVNGTGCLIGRLGTSLEFDNERNIVEISFRNYLTKTGAELGQQMDRKNCALAVPVKVPNGKRLVVSQIDLLAKLDFRGAAQASIGFEAFLGGRQGPLERKNLTHPRGQLAGRMLLRRNEVLRSNCGGNDILRINTSSGLQAPAAGELNRMELDRISLSLKIESC